MDNSSFQRRPRHLSLVRDTRTNRAERVARQLELGIVRVQRRAPRQETNVALDHVDLRLDLVEAKLDELRMIQGGLLTALLAEERLHVRVGDVMHKIACPIAQALVLRRVVDDSPCTCPRFSNE